MDQRPLKRAPCELILPFVVLLLLLIIAKSKERTRAPVRFPVLKGRISRQTVRAKHAGYFPLFNII